MRGGGGERSRHGGMGRNVPRVGKGADPLETEGVLGGLEWLIGHGELPQVARVVPQHCARAHT